MAAPVPYYYYAGRQLLLTAQFAKAGVLTDPTAGTVIYRDSAGTAAPTTVQLSAMTHVSTGIYTLVLDTTSFVPGTWDVQIVTTGAVATAEVVQFSILSRPLG